MLGGCATMQVLAGFDRCLAAAALDVSLAATAFLACLACLLISDPQVVWVMLWLLQVQKTIQQHEKYWKAPFCQWLQTLIVLEIAAAGCCTKENK